MVRKKEEPSDVDGVLDRLEEKLKTLRESVEELLTSVKEMNGR